MDIDAFLADVATDLRQPAEGRRLASHLLKQWHAGVVPAPNRVRELRKLLARAEVCGRLEADGSCIWLRRNAREEGLRPPAPNEKTYCKRTEIGKKSETFADCRGYIKANPNED